MAQTLQNQKIARKQVAPLGSGWVFNELLIGFAQFIFDVIQRTEEIGHRVDAVGNVGMGTVLDEELKVRAGPIEDRADLQAPRFPQLVAQIDSVVGRRLAREDVVGERPEREDVEMFTDDRIAGDGLRGHVGRTDVLHQAIDVGCGRDFARDARGGRTASVADLPVENLDPWVFTVWISNENTLRTKVAMDHAFLVGETDDFAHLAEEIESSFHVERGLTLGHIVIEPDTHRIVLEDQSGPQFVLGKTVGTKNPRMLEGLQELELSQGRSFIGPAVFRRCRSTNQIQPYTAFGVR